MLSRIFGTIFFLSLLGIILVLFQAGATSTGQVIFNQDYRAPGSSQVLTFSDPTTLKVFQSNLQAGRPDYYAFQGTKDSVITLKLDTLRLAGQDNFVPSLALFGPGLPPLTPDEQPLFPYSLPAGYGLLLSAESNPINQTTQSPDLPTGFDEPWTQSSYWERQSLLNQLPQDGTYYLAVYSLTGQSGKYALFVGDKPEAELRETLAFPVTWVRLHLWFEDLWWPVFALVVVVLAILALLFLWGRSLRKHSFKPLEYENQNEQPASDEKETHSERQDGVVPSDPALIPEHGQSSGNSSGVLPAQPSLFSWETQDKPATGPVSVSDAIASNGTGNNSPAPTRGDGLSEWGKRFRP